jgi:hypothetical protein
MASLLPLDILPQNWTFQGILAKIFARKEVEDGREGTFGEVGR